MTNPLLRTRRPAGLRRRSARARGAGDRRPAARRRTRARARRRPRRAGRVRRAVGGARRRRRAAVARLGRGGPPEQVCRHARAARRLQREPAPGHRASTPGWAPTSGCTPSTRRSTADAEALSAPRRRALANAMRDFVLGGAELQGAAKRALRCRSRNARPSCRSTSTSTCSTPPTPLPSTSTPIASTVCPTTCARRCAPSGSRRPRRLQAHAALPELRCR